MSRKLILLLVMSLVVFLTWRFIRPLNIFLVSEPFERPEDTSIIPKPLVGLGASECAACHQDFYEEWQTSIHSQAWIDPYFQTDWKFENSQQICRNCHTPLDRQQPYLILGFRDQEKWDPITAPNLNFDPDLQHEGVTCTACHLRAGKIVGVFGDTDAPHPVKKLDDPNQVCVRCHVVDGERWDTFFRFPPCGTVAEIRSTRQSSVHRDEAAMQDTTDFGCVQCHMPLVERPLAKGGNLRPARRHLWKGGHDPEMVKNSLEIQFEEVASVSPAHRNFAVTLTNVGAAHYLPTGTPDRQLTINLRLLNPQGRVLKQQNHTIKRTVVWRPFIVDLWDTRLPRWQPRTYKLSFSVNNKQHPFAVEAVVRYHLLDERRRKRIGYENTEPIAYEVFRRKLSLAGS